MNEDRAKGRKRFCSILIALSSERFFPPSPNQLRWWVTVGYGRDAASAYPPLLCVGHTSAKLNNMAVGTSQPLLWLAVPPPNGGLIKFILG